MTGERRLKLGILLLPQFSFAELGLILEPLFIVNWLLQKSKFEWQLLGLDSESVIATNGISVPVEAELPEAETFDIIFVLASFETKMHTGDRRAKIWLRRAASAGVEVCGIETGTEVLAAAGLLAGQQVAVHWDNLEGFQELYPDVDARPDLYTADSGRMSCAGGTAVVDLMLQWLQPKLDESIFTQLRSHLLEPRMRGGRAAQSGHEVDGASAESSSVRRAIAIMQRSLEAPLHTSEIAGELGVSVRQLERRFRSELSVTPSRYYMRLRIGRAHRLLQQTDLSVAEVAASAGFQSLEHFSRVYRKYYGCAPSRDRLQTPLAPSLPREP